MRILLNQLQYGCMIDNKYANDYHFNVGDPLVMEKQRFTDPGHFEYEEWSQVVSLE